MEGELKKLMEVWSSALALLCYCYFVPSRIPQGKYRLLSLLPVLSLFPLLPLHLTTAFPTILTASFLVCVANFRLLLFAFNLGPLSPHPPKSLPLFVALACLPVKLGRNRDRPSPQSKPSKLILNPPTETLLIALAVVFADRYREILDLHPKTKIAFYCCCIFLAVDVVMVASNAVVTTLLGLDLDPPSDEPFFSTSLQDFWGRRWNLMVTSHLRHTVYEPVRSALRAVVGRTWAGLVGTFAAFVVSGLMHELVFYYPTRVWPTWEMTAFFVLHGLCVVVEVGVKRAVKGRWRLHGAFSGPLTVGFVVVTASQLFFRPLMISGLDVRIQGEFIQFANSFKSSLYSVVKTDMLRFQDLVMAFARPKEI